MLPDICPQFNSGLLIAIIFGHEDNCVGLSSAVLSLRLITLWDGDLRLSPRDTCSTFGWGGGGGRGVERGIPPSATV